MAISVSRYIFCSKKGQKLQLAASIDVSTSEKKQLQSFNFDQIDHDYLQSLWPKPAYALTRLTSNRFAVIRLLPPQPNYPVNSDYFCFAVLIKPSDWLKQLNCDIEPILFAKDLWNWTGQNTLEPLSVKQAAPPLFGPDDQTRQYALYLLAHLEANWQNPDFQIIIDEKFADYQLFRWLNLILPSQQRTDFSYISRANTANLPFKIISLSKDSSLPPLTENALIWTPKTKNPSNKPYTDYIESLWQKGKLPPLSLIKNYTDFQNTQKIQPSSQTDQSINSINAREKILTYIAQHPVKTPRKYRFQNSFESQSIKNKNIILAAAALVLIAIAIYAGIWTKNKIYIYKFNRDTAAFLEQYPLPMVFQGQLPLEPILTQNRQIFQQIEHFAKSTKTDQLKSASTKLARWHDQAIAAQNQQTQIDSLSKQIENFGMRIYSFEYPPPQILQKIDSFYNNLKEIQKNCVLPSTETINLLQSKIQELEKFNTSIDNILNSLAEKTQNLQATLDQLSRPQYYSLPLNRKYQELAQKIEYFQSDKDLSNAVNSPRKKDAKKAADILDQLSNIQQITQNQLKALDSYLVNARNFIDSFNIQYHLSISNPREKLPQRIKQLNLMLESVKRFWPACDQLPDLNQKFDNIIKLDSLNSYFDQLEDIRQKISISILTQDDIDQYRKKLTEIEQEIDKLDPDFDVIIETGDKIKSQIYTIENELDLAGQKLKTAEMEPAEPNQALPIIEPNDVNEF